MNGAANVSMSVSRAIGQQSSTARSIRVKEQVPKPSAFESEIHPSHKSRICSLGISPCGAGAALQERGG